MIRALGALVVFVLATAPAHAQVTDKRVSLRVEGRALAEVAEYLRQQSGANIVVVEGGDTPISLDITDVPWREALDLAAELAGCVVEERTAGVLAIDSPPRVTFSFDDADIREIIDIIQKISSANIVVAPEVAGTLSLHLNDVPWREALNVAVKTLGYVVVEEARDILRIRRPSRPRWRLGAISSSTSGLPATTFRSSTRSSSPERGRSRPRAEPPGSRSIRPSASP